MEQIQSGCRGGNKTLRVGGCWSEIRTLIDFEWFAAQKFWNGKPKNAVVQWKWM